MAFIYTKGELPQVSIEQLLCSSYIKYENMLELTKKAVNDFSIMGLPCKSSDVINVYIDMHSMVTCLYGALPFKPISNPAIIAAIFINMCAHIRAYFRTRHRVETRIYIVYSENRGEKASQFYYGYNVHWRMHVQDFVNINELISSNIDLLEILCPYLNDIFLMKTSVEPAVAIFDRINKDEILYKDVPNFIFSKDKYMYQLPALKPNTVIFKPSKIEGNDESIAITHLNVFRQEFNQNQNTFRSLTENGVHPSLLSLILAMSHLTCRDLKACYNTTKAANTIVNLIKNGIITNSYNYATTLQDISDKIQPNLKNRSGPEYDVIARFKAVDVVYQHGLYMNTPECMDEKYLIRKIDNDGVRAINNQYFKDIPLDLNRL